MECFFLVQEIVHLRTCKFNLLFCLRNGFYLLYPWNERNTAKLAVAHLINHGWNWREFCCAGNKRPQPALVPGPDKVWLRVGIVYCSALCHISCWPCTEVTDTHDCTEDLVCQGSLFRRDWTMEGKSSWGEEEWVRLLCAESQMVTAGAGEWTKSLWQGSPVPAANVQQALVGSSHVPALMSPDGGLRGNKKQLLSSRSHPECRRQPSNHLTQQGRAEASPARRRGITG